MELIVDNGKAIEPKTINKLVAKVKRDRELKVTMPRADVQHIVGNHIYKNSVWLQSYTHFSLTASADGNEFYITFTKEEPSQ
jgi:hypothetical protein